MQAVMKRCGLAAVICAAACVPATADTTLTVWSHWADQQTKVAFVEKAARSLEAKNPGVKVQITWYQKGPLFEALGAALRAGKGPDIFYLDPDRPDFADNGLLHPLDDLVNWKQVEDWARRAWTRKGKTYALPLEASTVELYYNKKLLAQFGGDLDSNRQLSQAAFLDVVKKAKAANVTPIVQGVGDRPSPGAYVLQELTLKSLGPDDYRKLLDGKLSWKDPRVAKAFSYVQSLVEAGAYPASFTSLKLGESHVYFYSSPGGVMLPMGSWYTSRAFNPPASGGQPEGFPLGIMNFPALDGAACNACKTLAVSGSFGINAQSKNIKLAAALLDEMASPEMGNLWLSTVLVQTGIKTDPSKVQGQHKAYFADLLELDAKNTFFPDSMLTSLRGACGDAFKQILNVAFPGGLIKTAEAQEQMDKVCFKN